MKLFYKNDKTAAVITAEKQINSGHKESIGFTLPQNAIIFTLGKWDKVLSECSDFYLAGELPKFLGKTPVYLNKTNLDWCFVHGGHGSPQMADTVEILHAMGVKNLVLAGMVGAFHKEVNAGDILLPYHLRIEEGTSVHYTGPKAKVAAKNNEKNMASLTEHFKNAGFAVHNKNTVTTDAVYRQTFLKESLWRKNGYAAVEMEGSAFLTLCEFYNIPAHVVFIASDKHPLTPNNKETDWHWKMTYDLRKNFIVSVVDFFLHKK